MPLTEDAVREALKQVIDPELFINIIDLGLVYTVVISPAIDDAASATAPPIHQSDGAGQADIAAQPEGSGQPEAATEQGTHAGPKENVTIEMTMTSPACPAGPQLLSQSKQAISKLEGVGDIEVKLVMVPPWTPDRMTEDARDQLGIF